MIDVQGLIFQYYKTKDVNIHKNIIQQLLAHEGDWLNESYDLMEIIIETLFLYYESENKYKEIIDFCYSHHSRISAIQNLSDKKGMRILPFWARALVEVGDMTSALKKCAELVCALCSSIKSSDYENLFSFRAPSEFAINDIKNNTMSFQRPQLFNDPTDTLFNLWINYQIKKSENKDYSYLYKRAVEHIRARCFVQAPPKEAYLDTMKEIELLHPLMWAHYADSHRGICLEYDIKPSFFTTDISTSCTRLIHKEIYKPTFPDLGKLDVVDAFFRKSSVWEYENEVRIIDYDPNTPDDIKVEDLKDKDVTLKSVYLGCNCSDKTREEVKTALRNSTTELYKMKIEDNDPYRLKTERIG